MQVVKRRDSYYVYCGFMHRDKSMMMRQWCWETWGSGWGEYVSQMGISIFKFHRSDQANWFIIRWQDHS
jgi:hypothetical protein